ncbi:MAG: radical SAM protein [bacterium]|nr:radical SAM protein [bacterium]
MNSENKNSSSAVYHGFEQGPIRPPSEAYSLLIRVTRNCPWNRCTFCPVYKKARFSVRPVEHIIKDIDTVHKYISLARELASDTGHFTDAVAAAAAEKSEPDEYGAFQAAINWIMGGMRSIFLQDANSLVIKPAHMIEILRHLRKQFPEVERITSYARSDTIARITEENLKAMAEAGLNRIHIGLESGSDEVLKRVQKGVTKAIHIKGGLKVKQAGMELSEYVMPGLGGKLLWETHARETADALNRINPDFIRLRTLALPTKLELYKEYESGEFEKNTELETVKEILLFLENLEGITSMLKSDHILNLFQDLEGRLPGDKERMTGILKTFLQMDPERQCIYQVGRRMGLFNGLGDMEIPGKLSAAESVCRRHGVTPGNVDQLIENAMRGFV